MASKRRHYRPANVLPAFVKAFPIILIPMGALLCEAWLHLGILTFDYEGRALSMELSRTRAHIEELRARIAELERMERIDAEALELGLVMPEPDQVVTVKEWSAERAWDARQGFDVAHGRIGRSSGQLMD
ncbi:MAG TPA: hypothetical protein PLD73_01930 [Candidatus Hydrogenedentes bacterium]|mgnify:CR=1 FL=1|jgi:hypothetical protein|nr:hypothetical protein [Candidatus Hydrogenedentota bacterium]HPJ99475.1 hypothetical protein [Candidatus Hydrogenedentota bacterium]